MRASSLLFVMKTLKNDISVPNGSSVMIVKIINDRLIGHYGIFYNIFFDSINIYP